MLDDSTDETRAVAAAVSERYRALGYDVRYIGRDNRKGYKAGALQKGTELARGEFLLVFDADFVPRPEMLREVLPYFTDPRVGMVQARWEHLNRDYSLLTRIQSIFLDGHFVIEHTARHRSGRFFNFNGTAGIWRRSCLEEAGGWQSDTLTEDLDASYRAQLAGWRFVYLKDVVAPAELPVDMNAFKSQQHRWAKGSIQTGFKLLPRIFRSPYPWRVKVEAFFHLTNNFSYLLVVILALLIVPAIVIRERIGWQKLAFADFPLFFGATFSFIGFYISSQREIGREWRPTLRYMPFLMSLGIGLSLNNVRAVLEAVFGRPTSSPAPPSTASKKSEASGGTRSTVRSETSPSSVRSSCPRTPARPRFAISEGYWTGIPLLLIFFKRVRVPPPSCL